MLLPGGGLDAFCDPCSRECIVRYSQLLIHAGKSVDVYGVGAVDPQSGYLTMPAAFVSLSVSPHRKSETNNLRVFKLCRNNVFRIPYNFI